MRAILGASHSKPDAAENAAPRQLHRCRGGQSGAAWHIACHHRIETIQFIARNLQVMRNSLGVFNPPLAFRDME